jgi:streptogrisin C
MIGFAVAGTAVAASTVVMLGSGSASGPASPAGAGASGSTTGGNRVVMAAMQRDLSLTSDQSRSRLAKDVWGGGTERMLRQSLGRTFAGAWMSADGQDLMVGVTSEKAAAAVREAGATPKLVDRSESQLTTFKSSLDRSSSVDSGVTGWYVDPPSNQVVVVAEAGRTAEALDLAAARGVPSNAVRVVTTKAKPRLFFDVKGGDAYFIDNQFRCSIGFSVVGGFVSAGHCGTAGSTTTGFNQKDQGTFAASTFPGSGDFSFVKVNGDWTPQPVVATENGDVPVAGSQEAPVGAAICRTGSTTGTRCGVVEAKDATVRYPEGTVTGLTRTNVCAEGGDSGGPWMSGDQAQGVTSGGSGDCTVGGETFFQPIDEILTEDKVQLVTTAGESAADPSAPDSPTDPPVSSPTDPPASSSPVDPPATDPSVTDPSVSDPSDSDPSASDPADCENYDQKGHGRLHRNERSVLGSAGFFRSRTGRHSACIDGPDGAAFDLGLQRWTGERWKSVAGVESTGAARALTFSGRPGFYRYTLTATDGSGLFTLGID